MSDLHQMTGAYVLDSLDDIERAAFERHLTDCEACRTEVRELRDTVAAIGAAEATPPPPALRAAVFAEVRGTPQLPPHATPATSRRSRRWLQALAVAAVAAIAFGLGAWVAHRPAQQDLVAQGDEVAQIVMAPDARMATMEMATGSHSNVNVVVTPSMGKAMIVTKGLPTPPGSEVYQLWSIDTDGAKHPMNTFRPNEQGSADVMMTGDFKGVTGIAVTQEPEGGSAQPTTTPIGLAALPS